MAIKYQKGRNLKTEITGDPGLPAPLTFIKGQNLKTVISEIGENVVVQPEIKKSLLLIGVGEIRTPLGGPPLPQYRDELQVFNSEEPTYADNQKSQIKGGFTKIDRLSEYHFLGSIVYFNQDWIISQGYDSVYMISCGYDNFSYYQQEVATGTPLNATTLGRNPPEDTIRQLIKRSGFDSRLRDGTMDPVIIYHAGYTDSIAIPALSDFQLENFGEMAGNTITSIRDDLYVPIGVTPPVIITGLQQYGTVAYPKIEAGLMALPSKMHKSTFTSIITGDLSTHISNANANNIGRPAKLNVANRPLVQTWPGASTAAGRWPAFTSATAYTAYLLGEQTVGPNKSPSANFSQAAKVWQYRYNNSVDEFKYALRILLHGEPGYNPTVIMELRFTYNPFWFDGWRAFDSTIHKMQIQAVTTSGSGTEIFNKDNIDITYLRTNGSSPTAYTDNPQNAMFTINQGKLTNVSFPLPGATPNPYGTLATKPIPATATTPAIPAKTWNFRHFIVEIM